MTAVPLVLKLLTAHLAGDYLFQSSLVAREKYRPALLGAHLLVHGALLALVGLTEPPHALLWWALLGTLAAHGAIDAWTSRLAPRDLRLLALDQSLHLATLVAAAAVVRPDQLEAGWRALSALAGQRSPWIVAGGALTAVPAGATLVGRWVRPFREALAGDSAEAREGLERAGHWIGMLERTIIFIAVLGRAESLIAFVFAAKAVLRLPEARESHRRKLAEYYLVGSLASLAWGLIVAFTVRIALGSS